MGSPRAVPVPCVSDIANVRWLDAGIRQRGPNDGYLRGSVGRSQSTAGAVLIDRATTDDCQNLITLGLGVGEAFEDDYPAAFAAHESVRPTVECLAAAVWRQHVETGQRDAVLWRRDEVDAAGQRHPTLAAAQTLDGQVHRNQ